MGSGLFGGELLTFHRGWLAERLVHEGIASALPTLLRCNKSCEAIARRLLAERYHRRLLATHSLLMS